MSEEEEEILKIEKVRKVGPPTFKHLAKHTNFIQEYDEEKNKIKPSYLLNTYNYSISRIVCILPRFCKQLFRKQNKIKIHNKPILKNLS